MYVFPENKCLFKMKTSAEVPKITLCLRAVCFSVEERVEFVDLSICLIGFYLAGESRGIVGFFWCVFFTKKFDMKNRSLLLVCHPVFLKWLGVLVLFNQKWITLRLMTIFSFPFASAPFYSWFFFIGWHEGENLRLAWCARGVRSLQSTRGFFPAPKHL